MYPFFTSLSHLLFYFITCVLSGVVSRNCSQEIQGAKRASFTQIFDVYLSLLCARVHISILTLFECGLLIIIHGPYSYYVEENGERKKENKTK